MQEEMGEKSGAVLAVGIAVDHDCQPDCGSLARRGITIYRFPVRWSRVITSTTFYHNEPAVPFRGGGDGGDGDASSTGTRSNPCDLLAASSDVASWPHHDPRWHAIHADVWTGLPTAEVIIDLDAVHHYRVLMTTLRAHGVAPVPVLDQRDMPPVLRGVIGGWGSPLAIEAYAQFARAVFMRLGHLSDLWLGLVLSGAPLDRGPYAHRAARHMALGHARAASIYHRDLAGASGVAHGRFGAIIDCGRAASEVNTCPGANGGGAAQVNFERLASVFQSNPSSTTITSLAMGDDMDDDGFGWGFTASQRLLLSRSADVIVLDCTLPLPTVPMRDRHTGTCAADDSMRRAADDMALTIDRAAAALSRVTLIMCDGLVSTTPPYIADKDRDGDSTGRDLDDRINREDDHGPDSSDPLTRHSAYAKDGGHAQGDSDDGLYGDGCDKATATRLLGRFGAVQTAASAGRPVAGYLLQSLQSHAILAPYADPFCL
ncbi:Glycosyl hydrolase family 1 incomplete domain containing protein [Pandoravirus salinus]|uniref:Glycosyl hydrolase family 1 incomplete domain containing protein n=1 Tax=Pandoravirus salinus TaxID=1349410 RepID=S4VSX5_9VIRU|nr:6-phospho-beta-glucosidase incomplete domain [Pandoravirus salinus]AGO83403.1 Glycosyl hydrolase family 1 incomplete domain containing protein [Pandoravirus salinus]